MLLTRRPFARADYEAVCKLTDGFNGADLRNVCTEAGMFAIREERDYVVQVWGMRIDAHAPRQQSFCEIHHLLEASLNSHCLFQKPVSISVKPFLTENRFALVALCVFFVCRTGGLYEGGAQDQRHEEARGQLGL